MDDTVQIYAGAKETLPELIDRAFGYCRDARELYIGTPEGNVLLASVEALEAALVAVQGLFPAVTLTEDVPEADAASGMLFEDGGALKYKNRGGVVMVIAEPPEPEPPEGG